MLEHQQTLEMLLKAIGVSWHHIEAKKGFFDHELIYNVKGGDVNIIIKLGGVDALTALNTLFRAISEVKGYGVINDISIDIDNYRERKIALLIKEIDDTVSLHDFTVISTYQLRKLSAFERKVVHQHIQDSYPHLKTKSEGDGDERRLMLFSVN